MRAIIYSRVSTLAQEDSRSLEMQIDKGRDFCKIKNYEVYREIQDVESGGKDDRIGFLQLQEEVKNRSFDILVVYESSRISRVTLTLLNFVSQLQKSNINFVSISQPELDTTSPTGMLFFQIQAGLGEYERKQISARVKSNKWQRMKSGIWQGGVVPLGYKREDKKFIIDEDGANTVKAIFRKYLETGSLNICSKLFGIHMSSIRWVLSNPFYIGYYKYGEKENNIATGKYKKNKTYQLFKGEHTPIIDESTFYKIQKMLKLKTRVVPTDNKLLFTGSIECNCGGKFFRNKIGKHIYYRCDKCKKTLPYKKAEGAIINKLLTINELLELNKVDLNTVEQENQIKTFQNELKKQSEKRKKYIGMLAEDLITKEEFKSFTITIDQNITLYKNEIDNLKLTLKSNKSNNMDNLSILKEIISNIDDTDRNDLYILFKMLIEKIILIDKENFDFSIILKK